MTDYLTISSRPPDHPGMNFALLRAEGIRQIERLGGHVWTDYNAHDPGITILEYLCYAITDLSYRLAFEMEDLLAYKADNSSNAPPTDPPKQFFSASEILITNPLTINDYRKLLIDIDGVKNAWLEPSMDAHPRIYYDSSRHSLTFQPTRPETTQTDADAAIHHEPVTLKGFYEVLIAKEPNADSNLVRQTVISRLHQHRNVCEDFRSIKILPIEKIYIEVDIELEENSDINALMAQIYFVLDRFISPSIHFFSVQEMQKKGKAIEEIFDGPLLDHGFIDDDNLQHFARKPELYTSDLIRIILGIEDHEPNKKIKNIRSIKTFSDRNPETQEWVLPLDLEYAPEFGELSTSNDQALQHRFRFYSGQLELEYDLQNVQAKLEILHRERSGTRQQNPPEEDIPIPSGEDRELSDYTSIQNDLPETYGVGEAGLPESASPQRKAQAKQLKAYLMFFDQILANYMAQLDHMKNLFVLYSNDHEQVQSTYVSNSLTNVENASLLKLEEILNSPDSFQENIAQLAENEEVRHGRSNRFLNYLIAQFGERFTDASLLYGESTRGSNLIAAKRAFLKDYLTVSRDRSKAVDYTSNQPHHLSGLKQRISRVLGLDPEQSDFYLIEHLLLSPRLRPPSENEPSDGFLSLPKDSENKDPYSFQISFIFLNRAARSEKFKQLLTKIVLAETPAHITPYIHWIEQPDIEAFETLYQEWSAKLRADHLAEDTQDYANRLLGRLMTRNYSEDQTPPPNREPGES